MSEDVVIIGAGPAGLAAAYEMRDEPRCVTVLERDVVVGGLARTEQYKGFRCDIGGHRFFTKSGYVDSLWREVLGSDFLRRPRMSRIYYGGKFYSYPLKVSNVLWNLGLLRSAAVCASLLAAKLKFRKSDDTFEDWVSNRFGRKLYETFFRTYTEKIWGMSCRQLSSDWAAQRIRNLSAAKAILNALGLKRKRSVASLIEKFDYPALGPGQMYERMASLAVKNGAEILLSRKAARILTSDDLARTVVSEGADGEMEHSCVGGCFSSMPLDELVMSLSPPPPPEVLASAGKLSYRSIVTVNLMLDQPYVAPDTWIYIHDKNIRAGRMQLYKNWSPQMVPDPSKSVIGMEYFCTVGDQLWRMDDRELTAMAVEDLKTIGLVGTDSVFDSFTARYPKAYPVYRTNQYKQHLQRIRKYLATIKNLYPIGRYGQFRYNNMDHSILTAHYSVMRMKGENVDPWSVNVEQEHIEEVGARR